jgi:hypothetical protein
LSGRTDGCVFFCSMAAVLAFFTGFRMLVAMFISFCELNARADVLCAAVKSGATIQDLLG